MWKRKRNKKEEVELGVWGERSLKNINYSCH